MTDAEAARKVVAVARTREPLDDATIKRLSPRWHEAHTVARHGGMSRFLDWAKTSAARPDWREEVEAALVAALADPGDEAPPSGPEADHPVLRLRIIGASEMVRTEFRTEWLVKRVLVAHQPCIVGAPKKNLKTSTMIDLAVSLASATPFLGEFEIQDPATVIVLSGESGGFSIKETTRRVCDSKGIRTDDLEGRFYVGFGLPRLTNAGDLAELDQAIRDRKANVVIIDPIYLCLTGQGAPVDASNMFEMGPLLLQAAQVCLDAGATPILVHHFNKGSADPFAVPELNNLAYSGFQEFARQWILLGRRERFQPGTGVHRLWLTVGGSTGHSGEWAFDIDEGQMLDDFTGRLWQVSIKTGAEARTEEKEIQRAAREAREREKEIEKATTHRKQEDRVLEMVAKMGGSGTRSKVCDLAAMSRAVGQAAIARLVADGRLIETLVQTPKGQGFASVAGVGLRDPGQARTDPDAA